MMNLLILFHYSECISEQAWKIAQKHHQRRIVSVSCVCRPLVSLPVSAPAGFEDDADDADDAADDAAADDDDDDDDDGDSDDGLVASNLSR